MVGLRLLAGGLSLYKGFLVTQLDPSKWVPKIKIQKYDEEQTNWVQNKTGILEPTKRDFEVLHVDPYEVYESEGNLLLTAGATRIFNLLAGNAVQALNAANSRIGVGNGVTAENVADTDLSAAAGAANRYFMTMDATYPLMSGATVQYAATWASANGNFVWAEWGIDAGATAGTTVTAPIINRKVDAMGTKAAGSTWSLTVSLSLA